MDKEMELLGGKLKTFRKEANYTLKETAEKLGVSKAFLSMVENGKSGISFENLHKILKIYGKNLGDLTGNFAGEEKIISMRKSKKIASESGVDIYGLASVNILHEGYMAGFILDIVPGGANAYDTHSGLEYVFVIKGEIELIIEEPSGTRRIKMRTGDTEIHRAKYHHIYNNIGNDSAQVLVIESTSDKS